MGSSTAWWLSRRGVDVVLLEQFEQGHVRGSSHGGSRIFRLAYPEPDYVALAQRALPLWRELEDDAGVPLLDTTGGLDHGDVGTIEQVEAALASCGATSERLSPDAARERWPEMAFDRAVLFQPDAGRCRSDDTVRALQDRAAAHGALVQFGVGPATVSERDDGVVARCEKVDLEVVARAAVVTAGSWVERVAPGGIGLPAMKVTQEQIVHFPPRRRRRMAELHPPPRRRGRGRRLRAAHAGRGHQGRRPPRRSGHRSRPPHVRARRRAGRRQPCATRSSGSPESSPFQCSA